MWRGRLAPTGGVALTGGGLLEGVGVRGAGAGLATWSQEHRVLGFRFWVSGSGFICGLQVLGYGIEFRTSAESLQRMRELGTYSSEHTILVHFCTAANEPEASHLTSWFRA